MSDTETLPPPLPLDDAPSSPSSSPSSSSSSSSSSEAAPWGINPNTGKPYKRDPARYRKRSQRQAAGTARPPAAGGTAAEKRRTAAALGLLDIVALPFTLGGLVRDDMMADAVAIQASSPGIAASLAGIANTQDRLAAFLDKAGEVGPYFGLAVAVAPLVTQILCNHGRIPVGFMGTADPGILAAAGKAKLEAEHAAAEERARAMAAEAVANGGPDGT